MNKRTIITIILILAIFTIYQANAQLTLLIFGQSSIPQWKPIARFSPATRDLIDGQLHDLYREKALLQADIDEVATYPPLRVVHTIGGPDMSQADWNNDANASMAAINTLIAKLEAY